MERETAPYRRNVCVLTVVPGGFLVVNLAVWDLDVWKFVQGGLEEGEDHWQAAARELREELGVTSFERIGMSERVNCYDWPAETRAIYGNRYRGQEQRIVAVRLETIPEVPEGEVRAVKIIDRGTLEEWSRTDHRYFRDYNGSMPAILDELSIQNVTE